MYTPSPSISGTAHVYGLYAEFAFLVLLVLLCVCGCAITSLTLPAAVFVDEPTEGRVRGVQQDGICHGEIGGRQARLPQNMLQMQRLQQDTWVRLLCIPRRCKHMCCMHT